MFEEGLVSEQLTTVHSAPTIGLSLRDTLDTRIENESWGLRAIEVYVR